MTNQFGGQDGQDGVDAMWVIISAFIIFTMQSGFGLLESGKWNFFLLYSYDTWLADIPLSIVIYASGGKLSVQYSVTPFPEKELFSFLCSWGTEHPRV